MSKLVQKGNTKLINMYMFNLPATFDVCGITCKGCYAIKEQKRFPNILKSRQLRYEASLQLDFVSKVKQEITNIRNKPKHFRIHASGEFYNQQYLNNWVRIIQSFPDIIFYAYTKKMKQLDFSLAKKLPNLIIIDSFHYKKLNYGKLNEAPLNAFICPHQKGSTAVCGQTCDWCMKKEGAEQNGVYFVKH